MPFWCLTLALWRLLNKMRSDVAKEMIGKEQTCMVISEDSIKGPMLLAENGVFIRSNDPTLRMGQTLKVVPKRIEGLFCGENQLLILSVDDEKTEQEYDEEVMWNLLYSMGQEKLAQTKMTEGFNRSDLSLRQYCEKKFAEEMK